MYHPKTDKHVNPSVEVHHLVEKLSTAETLLTEVQRNVCNQGKTLCSPCIFTEFFEKWCKKSQVFPSPKYRLFHNGIL